MGHPLFFANDKVVIKWRILGKKKQRAPHISPRFLRGDVGGMLVAYLLLRRLIPIRMVV